MRVVVRCGFSGDRCPTFHADADTTVGDIKKLLLDAKQTTLAIEEMLLVHFGERLNDETLVKSLVQGTEGMPIR